MEPRRNQGCLDPETIAALADGRLSRRERRRLEGHLASCEECCTVLAEAIRDRIERRASPVTRVAARRAAWAAAALAASVLVAAVVWRYVEHRSDGRGAIVRGVGPLVSVATDRRSVDARVTGGFPWVPLEPLARSGAQPRTTPAWELLAAASRIRKDAETNPSPENRHALGVAHLVLGDLDDAVSVLRAAKGESSPNATLLNDLGAALLARGELQARPDDLVEALSYIEKALQANSSLKEALFNRAVALEKLHLDDKAAAAWEDYLSRGPEPGWADEARQRLEQLKKAKDLGGWDRDRDRIEKAAASGDTATVDEIVARRTQETRLLVQDELLGAWARAVKEGRVADASSTLATATILAAALTTTTGDSFTADAVAVVRATAARGPSGRLDALIRGHLEYRNGIERSERFEVENARPFFEEAQSALESGGSPLALWASYNAARCAYYRGALKDATKGLDQLLPEAERKSYLALTAHVNWLQGLMDIVQNRFDESLARYQRALATFETLHEEAHIAFVSSLVAENLGFLGDERESLRKILDALSRLPRVRDPGRAVVILMQAGSAASRQGFPDVALEFHDAAVERARQDGDPIDVADSLQQRALIASELGRFDGARSDLTDARAWISRIADSALRDRVEAEVRWVEGHLARHAGDSAQANGVLTEAIGFFSKAGHEIRLPDLYLERGRASRTKGDVAAAERDLKAGIEVFERHRAEIFQEPLRVSYFDTAHELFEEMMSLEIARGRPDAALAYLERGKTRDVLDRWRPAKPFAVETLPNAIPEGIAVIAYGVLSDRLLVWTLSHGSRGFTEESIEAEDLSTLVKKFRDELEGGHSDDPPEAAAQLYKVLIGPVASRLTGFATVVFIPDEILHAVPFAALADAKTKRFFVEDHSVVVAPSVALFLQASESRTAKASRVPSTLLAVGDPAFDAIAFPYLPRLSGAAAEAKRIAHLYPDALVLTGEAATREKFLAELGRYTVIHVASHALTNETDPMRSRLLFAPDPKRDGSGTVFAEDLYGKPFGEVRLVVLAACSTASGRISRGEGQLSLARPFLAGGVPAVVATLWEIEDAPSSELLTVFHREIAAGRSPEDALRDAQVALIEGSDPELRAPRSWAAFQLAGGVERPTRG